MAYVCEDLPSRPRIAESRSRAKGGHNAPAKNPDRSENNFRVLRIVGMRAGLEGARGDSFRWRNTC
jgi:hypothetical protein